jgi:hypothetical protein
MRACHFLQSILAIHFKIDFLPHLHRLHLQPVLLQWIARHRHVGNGLATTEAVDTQCRHQDSIKSAANPFFLMHTLCLAIACPGMFSLIM